MDKFLSISYIIIYIFVGLFGVCVGSFLNVCIYRLPKNESLTKRNSHCMKCGEEIKRRDLIPIISWCLLRGKCRNCKEPISPRYTVVEALTGVLWLLTAMHLDVIIRPLNVLFACLVVSALIVVFFMDWDTQLINMWVVLFIALIAILQIALCRDFYNVSLLSHIIGIFTASIPLLLVVLISHERAMGWGDFYLMAAAGLYLGIQGSLVALGTALITGSIGGLILKRFSGSSKFAFGPFLTIGIIVAMFFGNTIGDWYMNFTGLNELLEITP